MIRAEYKDKGRIVDILSESFNDNKSVNYLIKQNRKSGQKIKQLMAYSFEVCYLFGEVFLTEDKKGCALIVFPDKKRTTLKSIILDFQLVLTCTGFSHLGKAMARESKIQKLHPKDPIYYLWFIGVDPKEQHKGTGTSLLKEVINRGNSLNRPVYLETSTLKNISWYEKLGFTKYHELDLGYRLYFFKKE